ncbi:MAG: hypothetical protein DRJ65_22575 [Acidobacteria bacterium]|nr:MAG: hypothetical protein DRJ65_22575 [Acidobacteriota bacterium]
MRCPGLATYVGVVLTTLTLGGLPAATAEDPQPTPAPKAETAKTKRPKSLADLAGGIKLQQPENSKEGGVVIDNSNLKEMGEGAVISEGKSLSGSAQGGSRMPALGSEQGPSDADLDKARQEVELLQAQLKAVNQATEENQAVNLYNGMGPQYRAPGQSDPLQNQRRDLEKKLEDAQGSYTALEKQKAKASRGSGSPSGVQPTREPTKRKPVTR